MGKRVDFRFQNRTYRVKGVKRIENDLLKGVKRLEKGSRKGATRSPLKGLQAEAGKRKIHKLYKNRFFVKCLDRQGKLWYNKFGEVYPNVEN